MGEKIDKSSMALYGDRDTNLSYRNTTESWTRADDENKIIVERCGFVPLRNRVLALLQSGERLFEARRDAFVYAEDEEPEDFEVDETLQQDFTELDALQTAKDIVSRAKARKKENERHSSKSFGNNFSSSSSAQNEMTSDKNTEKINVEEKEMKAKNAQ